MLLFCRLPYRPPFPLEPLPEQASRGPGGGEGRTRRSLTPVPLSNAWDQHKKNDFLAPCVCVWCVRACDWVAIFVVPSREDVTSHPVFPSRRETFFFLGLPSWLHLAYILASPPPRHREVLFHLIILLCFVTSCLFVSFFLSSSCVPGVRPGRPNFYFVCPSLNLLVLLLRFSSRPGALFSLIILSQLAFHASAPTSTT